MKLLIWIFLFTFSTMSSARDYFTDAQTSSIKKQLNIHSNYPLTIASKGVLSDGFEYVSVVFDAKEDLENAEKLRIESEDTTLYTTRCAVFKLTGGSKLELLGKSAPITNGGIKSNINCVIQKRSVVISIDGWSGTSGSSSAYRFVKSNDELLLAGLDEYSYNANADGDDAFVEDVSSYNLFTGQGIYAIKEGKNIREYKEREFPVFPFRVIKPYKYKEKKFVIKPYPEKTTFTNVNPEKVYEWIKRQENAKHKL